MISKTYFPTFYFGFLNLFTKDRAAKRKARRKANREKFLQAIAEDVTLVEVSPIGREEKIKW